MVRASPEDSGLARQAVARYADDPSLEWLLLMILGLADD